MPRITRDTQKPKVIYYVPGSDTQEDAYFVTPDGIRRDWYDSYQEAMEATGITVSVRAYDLDD